MSVWTGVENLASTGIRSPYSPARSQSLYRLSYPGPHTRILTYINDIATVSYQLFSCTILSSSLNSDSIHYESPRAWLANSQSGCFLLQYLFGKFLSELQNRSWRSDTEKVPVITRNTRSDRQVVDSKWHMANANNTLRTGEAYLRFYIITVQDGWRKSAFLTRACFLCTIYLIMQYIEPVSEWSCWRMFIETWPYCELTFRHRASDI